MGLLGLLLVPAILTQLGLLIVPTILTQLGLLIVPTILTQVTSLSSHRGLLGLLNSPTGAFLR